MSVSIKAVKPFSSLSYTCGNGRNSPFDSRERSIQRVKDVRLPKTSHSHTRSYVHQWNSWGKSRTLLHLRK